MRRIFIAIGISLVFFIGMAAQASAQKIHCWDLDRDNVCDLPDEDINGDGKCNSRDCQAEPEPVSISCWDLNGDGNCDVDEDKNGDTICDAYDCQGINCWDLNQNRLCDTSTEDLNGDGNCDVLDCREPPGEGCLRVYSGNNENLGVFAGTNIHGASDNRITVYLPADEKYLRLRFESAQGNAYNANRIYGSNNSIYLWFLLENCAGEEVYINTHSGGGEYFI